MSQRYLAELERRVASLSSPQIGTPNNLDESADQAFSEDDNEGASLGGATPTFHRHDPMSEPGDSVHHGLRATPESDIRNPLDPTISNAFTVDTGSKHFFL